ncbi:MAG: metallophosphoesterase [Bacteroidetes bacterium]|nr:MAG: metallophosphoesterase [Bacteroidota bacterium]
MIKAVLAAPRRFLQWVLTKPITALANKMSSAPKKPAVFASLSKLYDAATDPTNSNAELIEINTGQQPLIIFSDLHKGGRNGADDFRLSEKNYLAALQHYNSKGFYYINLGDSEELWENNIFSVLKHNKATFAAEKRFVDRQAFCKVYGNHDIFWKHDPLKNEYLKTMYGQPIPVYGGVLIQVQLRSGTTIQLFCTHGHQGDANSDGNWLSAFFVTYFWGPLQAFLRINTNTPATVVAYKTLHNSMMYDWSAAQQNMILVTGHTHQPVFKSLTHLERLYQKLDLAKQQNDHATMAAIAGEIPRRRREYDHVNDRFNQMRPTYFNTGCGCFSDGTVSGLEIDGDMVRLVLWKYNGSGIPTRQVAEEASLEELSSAIG